MTVTTVNKINKASSCKCKIDLMNRSRLILIGKGCIAVSFSLVGALISVSQAHALEATAVGPFRSKIKKLSSNNFGERCPPKKANSKDGDLA
jgi:hypothetical protein